jgi:hypothetical protein
MTAAPRVGYRYYSNVPRTNPSSFWLAALDPHRDYIENSMPNPHQPSDVIVPAHLPDTPEVRMELALYYDEITGWTATSAKY